MLEVCISIDCMDKDDLIRHLSDIKTRYERQQRHIPKTLEVSDEVNGTGYTVEVTVNHEGEFQISDEGYYERSRM